MLKATFKAVKNKFLLAIGKLLNGRWFIMHIVLKNQVDELIEEHDINDTNSKMFEYFCNFCIVSKYYLGRFHPKDVTTEGDDASIDGVAVIIDGELILNKDDAIEVFKTHKNNLPVEIILTQIKSSEKFLKKDIANYKLGIDDFTSLKQTLPSGDLNKRAIEVINVIFENLKKIKSGRPSVFIYYCTAGVYKSEREIGAAFDLIKRSVESTDYFEEIYVYPMGRTELLKLYSNLKEKNEARLKVIEYFGIPKMSRIPQAYVALVNAHDFVKSLLLDGDNNLKQSVFEENIRSFLGKDNDVNSGIITSLEQDDKKEIFSVLNNGITISAPELTLAPNTKEIILTNYQIINGCQTSNSLYEKYDSLTDEVNIIVKFFESPDSSVANDVISATNSQSDISKESFLGLKNKAKHIKDYFDAKNKSVSSENNIFFERRQAEFKGKGYQATRIFTVKDVARCYAAMFLNIPHNSFRYVKMIFSTSGDRLFRENDHESYYYAACLCFYKYQTLINGKRNNAHNYAKRKWHILQMYKWLCHNTMNMPNPDSNKADSYAQTIIQSLLSKEKYIDIFNRAQEIIDTIGSPTDDELKRQKFTSSLMEMVKENITRSVEIEV